MFLGILGTSWCRHFWELLFVQGILTGIGMGLAFGGGILVLQSYFTANLGAAAGLTSAGGSIGMLSSACDPRTCLVILKQTGGMVYPAIAEQLVPKIGFGNTMRGTVKSISHLKAAFTERLVFAAVAFVTLAAATCMVCQRSDPGPEKPEMDWGMLKDVPFLLMTASKYNPLFKTR